MSTELAVLRERVKDMEARDKVLKDTLITAQQIKTDINESAHKEAELIIKEAQLRADALHEKAREEVMRIRLQVAEVKRVRDDILAEAEMMVARFTHFVEAERQVAVETDKLHSFLALRERQKRAGMPSQEPRPTIKTVTETKGTR